MNTEGMGPRAPSAEELDPCTGRMQGNFPQALSPMAPINTARLLC